MKNSILLPVVGLLAAFAAVCCSPENVPDEKVELPELLSIIGEGCEFEKAPRAMREVEPGRWVVYSRFNVGKLIRIVEGSDTLYRGRVPTSDIYRVEYNAKTRKASWVLVERVSLEAVSGAPDMDGLDAEYIADGKWKVSGLTVRNEGFRYRFVLETSKPWQLHRWCSGWDNVGTAPDALSEDYLRVRDLGDDDCDALYIKDTRACWMLPASKLPSAITIEISMNGPEPSQTVTFADIPVTVEHEAVFMGDSITWQWTYNNVPYASSIALFESRDWVNKGISGNTTTEMVARFRTDVLALHPRCMVLMGGTNDIANSSESAILGRLSTMAEMARDAGIAVVLASVPPCNKLTWMPDYHPEDKIIKLNGMIRAYAESMGFAYADYWSVLADDAKGLKAAYQKDTVHPNADGYLQMETVIVPIIDSILTNN